MPVLRLPADSGAVPRKLIVLLHGVGADAESMRSLGQALQFACPDCAIIIPDAPHPSDLGGTGFQWFSVRGVTDDNRSARIAAALPSLDAFIADQCKRYGLGPDRLAIAGFSQGAMMALALADQERPPAAIAAIAGRISRPVAHADASPPHILLTHGTADPVVPFACLSEAEQAFAAAGYDVHALSIPNLGHTIVPDQARAIAAHFSTALAAASLVHVS